MQTRSKSQKQLQNCLAYKVAKVNTINVNGGNLGARGIKGSYACGDWQKAIVALTEDSKSIEFFDSMM